MGALLRLGHPEGRGCEVASVKRRRPPEWVRGGTLLPTDWELESRTRYYLRQLKRTETARRIARMELVHGRAIRALREAETLDDFSLPPLIRDALDELTPKALPDDFFYRLVRVEEKAKRPGPGRPKAIYRDHLFRELYNLYIKIGFDVNSGPLTRDEALNRLFEEFGSKYGLSATDSIRKIVDKPDDPRFREGRVHNNDLANLVSWVLAEVERAGK